MPTPIEPDKPKRGRPPKNPVEVLTLTDEERREQRYTPGMERDTRNPKGAIREQQMGGLLRYRNRRSDLR